MEIIKTDYFNLSANATLSAAGASQIFVPLAYDQYAYINRLSGYNAQANAYNGVIGIIDEQGNQTPIEISACSQYAAFNTLIDKVIRPEFGAYWGVTATSYPVTAQMMIDGYFFYLE